MEEHLEQFFNQMKSFQFEYKNKYQSLNQSEFDEKFQNFITTSLFSLQYIQDEMMKKDQQIISLQTQLSESQFLKQSQEREYQNQIQRYRQIIMENESEIKKFEQKLEQVSDQYKQLNLQNTELQAKIDSQKKDKSSEIQRLSIQHKDEFQDVYLKLIAQETQLQSLQKINQNQTEDSLLDKKQLQEKDAFIFSLQEKIESKNINLDIQQVQKNENRKLLEELFNKNNEIENLYQTYQNYVEDQNIKNVELDAKVSQEYSSLEDHLKFVEKPLDFTGMDIKITEIETKTINKYEGLQRNVYKDFFRLTCQSVKLNSQYFDEIYDLDLSFLYKTFILQDIPYHQVKIQHQWYKHIRVKIDEIITM